MGQRSVAARTPVRGPGVLPPTAAEALRSPGAELDPALRSSMESRIGHDFGAVRIHHDAAADTAASELGAAAFTVGSDIAFRAGRYTPSVLTHELVHVVQQQSAGEIEPERSEPGDRHERAADAVAHGGAATVARGAAVPMVQLQAETEAGPSVEQLRRDAIVEADWKIAEIDEALANGYIWWFEQEVFSGRGQAATAAISTRSQTLRELARLLSDLIVSLEAGDMYPFLRHRLGSWRPERGKAMNTTPIHDFIRARGGNPDTLWQPVSWNPRGRLQSYLFFPLDRTAAVVPREAPTGVKRAAPTAAPAPAPAPEAKPEPAREAERTSATEATGWYIQISDPRRPTEVRELVAPADAAFVYAEPRTSKNFALFRDAAGRFYYNGPDGRVDLPGLLEQFPAAANPAPRPSWQDEPQEAAGEPSPRRRPLTPRR
jgi:hypothetical protein